MQTPNIPHTHLVDAGAATTVSVDVPFKAGNYRNFVAYLNVTAHSGTTPTLDCKFQDSPDGGTTWYDITSAAFTQVTTTNGQSRLAVSGPFGPNLRAHVVLGGTTPSYTVSLDVEGAN